jgi:CRP-like cAMP-binding protein
MPSGPGDARRGEPKRREVAALTRQDLAEMVFTSPYTVSRILAAWRGPEILDAQRAHIVVRDPDRLAAIAAGRGPRGHQALR